MENQLIENDIIRDKNGKIFVGNHRVVMTPSSGIGLLYKNLLETIGSERAKTFLIRYGWSLGESDAGMILDKMSDASMEELIMEGPKRHMLMGHAMIEAKIIRMNIEKKFFHIEGTWRNSYEAREYLGLFGLSEAPVCHILVGYASGYTSKIFGTTVIFKETSCEAMGNSRCHWVGKSLKNWNGEVDHELSFFHEENLIHELENAYKQIVIERDNLDKTYDFHKKLMEQVMLDKDFHSIAVMVHQFLNLPIIISNQNMKVLTSTGLSADETTQYLNHFNKWYKNNLHGYSTKHLKHSSIITINNDCKYLVSAIIVRQKVVGYCCLILGRNEKNELFRMILERTTAACAIYILNKQIAFETEQRTRGYFLEQILSQQLKKEDIIKWGDYVGIDLEETYYIVVLNQLNSNKSLQKEEQIDFNEHLIRELSDYFTEKSGTFLICQRMNHIVILIQGINLNEQNSDKLGFLNKTVAFCQSLHRGKKFKLGVSSLSNNIEMASHHYEEALAANKMAGPQKQIISYEDLGAVGILIQSGNPQIINKFTHTMLGSLVEYDKKKGTEAVKTVYVYLNNGGNLELTANELVLSISGLRYRLQKIERILGFDIRDPQVNYQLYLAIQLLILFGEVDLEL